MTWHDLRGYDLDLYELFVLDGNLGVAWDQWAAYRRQMRYGYN